MDARVQRLWTPHVTAHILLSFQSSFNIQHLTFINNHPSINNQKPPISCKLTACQYKPIACHPKLRTVSYELIACPFKPRAISFEPRTFSFKLRAISFEPRTFSFKLRTFSFELRAFPPALRTVPHALRGVSCALRTVSRPFTSVLSVATGCCLISRKILMGLLGGSLVFIIINLFRQQIDGLHRGVPLFLLLV